MPRQNKFHASRRELLKLSGLTTLTLLSSEILGCAHLFGSAASTENSAGSLDTMGFVIAKNSPEAHGPGQPFRTRVATPSKILFSNFSGTKTDSSILLSFLAHQTIQNPQDKTQFISVQKWGGNAVVFNYSNPTDIRKFPAPDDFVFFGHGAFTPDGQQVMLSGMNNKDVHGEILVYDVRTQALLYRVNTMGLFPHEIQLSRDGSQLFALNSGYTLSDSDPEQIFPSLVKIDLRTRKVVEQMKSPTKQDLDHFVTADEKTFLLMGVGKQGSLVILGPDHFVDLTQDPLLKGLIKGEALSGRILNDGRSALVTFPQSNKLALIDIEQGKTLKVFDFRDPHAVVLFAHKPVLLVSSGLKDQGFLAFSSETKELMPLSNLTEVSPQGASQWIAAGAHFNEIIWPGA